MSIRGSLDVYVFGYIFYKNFCSTQIEISDLATKGIEIKNNGIKGGNLISQTKQMEKVLG